jgi:peptidoglycan hydrolase CwlO-like protein
MWLSILAIWGCVPEFTKNCIDMTNSSSTYLGIAGGAAIGAIISWWIYNRQKKTSRKQDDILQRVENLEEKNRKILAHLETFAKHHDNTLNKIFQLSENILALNKKIESMTEK